MRVFSVLAASVMAVAFIAACNDDPDVRTLRIAAGDGGCTPAQFSVSAGEKLRLVITNEGDAAYAVQDEAQQLELLSIPAGESVEADYTVHDVVGAQVIRCSREGGPETDIDQRLRREIWRPGPELNRRPAA